MDKKALSANLDQIAADLANLLERVNVMRGEVDTVVHNLEQENQYIRERLQDLEQLQEPKETKNTEALRLQSQQSLTKLYEDGFHICQASYGAKREGECMFCLELLYREP